MPPPRRRPRGTPNGSVIEPRHECTHKRGYRRICKGHLVWWGDVPWCPYCRMPRRRGDDARLSQPDEG